MSQYLFDRSSRRSNRPWQDAARFCTVTMVLMAISIIVTGLSKMGSDNSKVDLLFYNSQKPLEEVMFTEEEYMYWEDMAPEEILRRNEEIQQIIQHPHEDIKRGQVWRAFTPMFLHFHIFHIVFNMMWLWQFGLVLETRFRSLPFLALVLFIALTSNVAQAFDHGANFGGMSGVNYGLFGFMLARTKLHPNPGFVLNPQTTAMLLIWLVICYLGAMGKHIANTAHLVGFAAGGLVGIVNAVKGGAWELMQRKRKFRSALRSSANALHRCKVCQRTELDNPDLEFYVHPADGEEYCKDHLPQ